MSTNGETADLMVREGIQITESALKLAGLGACLLYTSSGTSAC